jgi:hypothetical protein
MAKVFSGQTTALTRLGAGLSKTTLASGDMNKILDELSTKFAGQAKARLTTYAGKMDLLQVASANVAETIGKGILDALSLLGKDKNLQDATTKMENFGTFIADAILGLGLLLEKLDKIGNNNFIKVLGLSIEYSPVGLLSKLGKNERLKNTKGAGRTYQGGQTSNDLYLLRKKELDAIKKANAARAAELALLNKRSEVDRLKDKFDLERIGLMVALNSATDEETKLRLKAQLAILDNNEALSKKYLAELNAKTAIDALAGAATSAAIALGNISSSGVNISGKMATIPDKYFQDYNPNYSGNTSVIPSNGGTTVIDNSQVIVNNAGSVLAEQDLVMTVQDVVLAIKRQGRGLNPAGVLDVGF